MARVSPSPTASASAAPRWTPWRPVAPDLRLTPTVLTELLDGGQSFRWWPQLRQDSLNTTEFWWGQWKENVTALRLGGDGRLEWSAPATVAGQVEPRLPEYLGLTSTHDDAVDGLPWRSDSHLAACLTAFPGLRILRQPFDETLLGFLCSATKQIVQIKQMLALLARRFGRQMLPPSETPGPTHRGAIGWRLPTWGELANVAESSLRECLLGFRARYIHQTAQFLTENPGWLEETASAPYAVAKERLCGLPGVGEKVADCVLLFGAGRLEAFPVDVWILKAMARRYGLERWPTPHVAQFGRVHFGRAAGLAQQYLFAYERAAARESRGSA